MSEQPGARRDPRPDPRPVSDDPRARAAARAAELREHGGIDEDGTDDFRIDAGDIPDGWAYEWKRDTTLGAEDPSYQVQLARSGWEPVPTSRHPSYMPKGAKGNITRKGMELMEKPREIVDDSRKKELRDARSQVRQKEAQLGQTPQGTLSREADDRVKPRINKSFEAIPIPD